jgi:hypothetical protein
MTSSGPRPEVNKAFGAMRLWPVDKGLGGSLADRAAELLRRVQGKRAGAPSLTIRAMALELAAAFAYHGQHMTPEMLKLLALAMDVPSGFLSFPDPTGHDGRGQGADPNLRRSAMLLEACNLHQFRSPMSGRKLARLVGVTEATIRAWRSDPIFGDVAKIYSQNIDPKALLENGFDTNAVDLIEANARKARGFEQMAAEEGDAPSASL